MNKFPCGAAICWLLLFAVPASANEIRPQSITSPPVHEQISPLRQAALPRTPRAPWLAGLPIPTAMPDLSSQSVAEGRQEVQVLTGSGYAGLFPIQSWGNRMGSSIARDGTTLAVGAIGAGTYLYPPDPYTLTPPTLGNGSVYLFEKVAGVWQPAQKVSADDGVPGEAFGHSVAIDGDTLMVGAVWATVNDNYGQGAVYVFERKGATWTQTQKLTADDGMLLSEFGWSIALQDGVAIIGAPTGLDPVTYLPEAGAAYVFTESDGVWTQHQKLTGSNVSGVKFGHSVALDGPFALIGSPGTLSGRGTVHAFDTTGASWIETQQIMDCYQPDVPARFGHALAMQGSAAVVGAPRVGTELNPSHGAACLLEQSGGSWSVTHAFISDDGATDDAFGISVAFDDGLVAISAPQVNGGGGPNTSQGAVYVFRDAGNGWSQVDKLDRTRPPQLGDGWWADSLGSGGVAIDGDAVLVTTLLASTFGTGNVAVFDFPAQPQVGAASLALSVAAGESVSQTIDLENDGTWPLAYAIVDGTVLSQVSSGVASDDVPNTCFLVNDADPSRVIGTADNAWYRRFYFDEHPQVGSQAAIDAVTIGIQNAAPGTPLTINLYAIPRHVPADTIDFSQMTLIGTHTFAATGGPALDLQVPVHGVINDTVTQDLVVEYRVPWIEATPVFLPALNSQPQTHNAFYASGCNSGYNTAGRWSHILISPHLDAVASGIECANPSDIPWLSVSPGEGAVGSGTSQAIAVTIDASDLAPGHYATQVCVETKAPLPSMTLIPIDVTVTESNDRIFFDGFEGAE